MDESDRAVVIALGKEGYGIRKITKATGYSWSFVRRWYHRTSTNSHTSPGRPPKLTNRVINIVKQVVKVSYLYSIYRMTITKYEIQGKKRRSTRRAAEIIKDRYGINLGNKTVHRAMKRAGLKPIKRQRKPLLTDRHKQRRLEFVRKYKNQDWRLVLFTDEKTFELYGRQQHNIVWAASADEVPASAVVKHPPKLHVWGGMSYYGRTKLFVFTGNMDAEFYKSILEERLLLDAREIFDEQLWVLQADNDPKHTSRLVQQWIQDNVPRQIPRTDWPANSPDLNVIEHVWAHLQARVYGREPRTLEGLHRILLEEWEATPIEFLQNLVDSMPRRLEAVRLNQGGSTRY
jgi:transposase